MSQIKKSRGRGRGILGLTSFEPCPRPSHAGSTITSPLANEELSREPPGRGSSTPQNNLTPDSKKPVNIVKPLEVENNQEASVTGKVMKVLAKYNYKAKLDCPGGFRELTIIQGERLTLLRKGHRETNNPLWWEVQNSNGETGFAPHNYLQVLDEIPSNLPWLENRRLLEDEERKKCENELAASGKIGFGKSEGAPKIIKYQSAYATKNATNAAEAAKKFYCEVCDKNLNGPQPYKMHINSKSHLEELEYQKVR